MIAVFDHLLHQSFEIAMCIATAGGTWLLMRKEK